MTTDKEHKLAAYWLVTGKMPSNVDVSNVNKPHLKKAVDEMQQTISAMKNWRDAHEKLAAPVLRPAAKRIVIWRWAAIGAAAAAVIVACVIGWNRWNAPESQTTQVVEIPQMQLSPQVTPTQQVQPAAQSNDGPDLAKVFEWTDGIKGSPPPPLQFGQIGSPQGGGAGSGVKGTGSSSTKPSGRAGLGGAGMDGGPAPVAGGALGGSQETPPEMRAGGPTVSPAGVPEAKPPAYGMAREEPLKDRSARERFAAKFPFAFQVPPQLPGGWNISRGRAVAKDQVQLVYTRGSDLLTVFLTPSAGPDAALQPLGTINRDTLILRLAARKSGLAAAFRSETAADGIAGNVIDLFLPGKGK